MKLDVNPKLLQALQGDVDARQLMSEAKFFESYSRWDDKLGRYETWEEAVHRVMEMHRTFYKDKMSDELSKLMDEVEQAYKDKLFLGSQRALQFGGEQLLKNHSKNFNCTATYIDRVEVFAQIFHLMLSGCGVGFSVQYRHIEKMPKIKSRGDEVVIYVIPDSIEGWADACDVLLCSYFTSGGNHPEYRGKKIKFDYSHIRPKGAHVSGGFKAPGPDGLKIALERIQTLINKALEEGRDTLLTIELYDIIMFISDAVISGGVRRSATICLFSHDDELMLNAKTGDWWQNHGYRARSNNSAVLLRGEVSKEEFEHLMKSVKDYGEPGFIWVDDLDALFNPCCVSGNTSVMTKEGPKLAKDLVGKQFIAIVDGQEYLTNEQGFWSTGEKQLYKLVLTDGYNLELTADHRVLTKNRGWVETKDLTSDDSIVLNEHTGYEWGNNDINEDFEKAWLLGMLVGDGTFDEETAILKFEHTKRHLHIEATRILDKYFKTTQKFGTESDRPIISLSSKLLSELALEFDIKRKNKDANHLLEEQSSSFYKGYLRGLFDTDGSVQGNQLKGVSIRLTQTDLCILEQAQRMLIRLGIKSKIYKNRRSSGQYLLPDGKGGLKPYSCLDVHELIIANFSLVKFANIVGFSNINKLDKVNNLISKFKRMPNKDKFFSKIESIIPTNIEEVFDVTVPGLEAFDANGIYVHNCEIGLYGYTREGESGVAVCNLAEINGMFSVSKEIFLKQCKYASIICTLQAGYTDFKYQSEATRKIIEDEALIGVSITGWMNNPEILFDIDILDAGVNEVAKWNEITAGLIDINIAARMTTVKPAGNTSTLLGSASGIHGEHSKYYLRHVQFNKETEIAKLFMEHYPKMVEPSVYSKNDIVVAFPVTPKDGSIFKKDLLGTKQLDYVMKAQKYWVAKGTRKERGIQPWLVHNVSNTITVDDWDKVSDYIYDNRADLGGVSLLAASGDKAYTQAPFTEVIMLEDIVAKYGNSALFASGLIEAGITAFNGDLWNAIATALGYGEKLTDSAVDLLKRDFVRRFNKFSHRFMPNHIDEVKDYIIHYDKYEYIENKISNIKEELNETMNDLLGNSSKYERLAGDMIRYVRELEDIRPYLNSTKINEHKQESMQTCSDCLKDVYNLHKWINITNSLKKELKWEELLTEKKYTDVDTLAAQACSGGACEVSFN